jgi:hypothetical protein
MIEFYMPTSRYHFFLEKGAAAIAFIAPGTIEAGIATKTASINHKLTKMVTVIKSPLLMY